MNSFREVTPDNFICSPFKSIGSDWMLIAASDGERVNAMTASWGGMGVLWGKNCVFIFVRESRFTKELIDSSNGFSVTFFDREKYAGMLGYMGKASGRNEDKIASAGLAVLGGDVPYFEQAQTAILCEKLCRLNVPKECILSDEALSRYYPNGDYHDMYVGEIKKILVKDSE